MSDLQTLLRRVVVQLQAEEVPIRIGVPAATIADFELRYHVKLPPSMRTFYSFVDGMGQHYDSDAFVRFWPFEEIRPISEYLPEFHTNELDSSEYFVFFDHSIDISLHAIRLSDSENTQSPIAHVQPPFFELRFESFVDFLSAYLKDPNSLI